MGIRLRRQARKSDRDSHRRYHRKVRAAGASGATAPAKPITVSPRWKCSSGIMPAQRSDDQQNRRQRSPAQSIMPWACFPLASDTKWWRAASTPSRLAAQRSRARADHQCGILLPESPPRGAGRGFRLRCAHPVRASAGPRLTPSTKIAGYALGRLAMRLLLRNVVSPPSSQCARQLSQNEVAGMAWRRGPCSERGDIL